MVHRSGYKYGLFGLCIFAASITFTMDTENIGNADANTFTDLVRALTKKVLVIREQSAKIADPAEDLQARDKIVSQIQALLPELESIQKFVDKTIKKDPDFKNKLNSEGMPARIIEGELELVFRYDLDAVSRSMGLGGVEENYDLAILNWIEGNMYDTLENLLGPNIRFNNLGQRYKEYKRFLFEETEKKPGKRYTPQEAHVALHIAAYVTAVEQAYDIAKYDHGRHLVNLLKVYVDWLQTYSTHSHYDVDIIKAHGSILSTTDKSGKTMLDWTNELSKKLNSSKVSGIYLEEAKEQFAELKRSLRKGLFKNPETGVVEPVKTRDVLKTDYEKLDAWGFKKVKKPLSGKLKGLNLETNQDIGAMQEEVEQNLKQSGKKETTRMLFPEHARAAD